MPPIFRFLRIGRLFSPPSRVIAKRGKNALPSIAAIETLEDRRLLTVVMSPYEQLLLELVNRTRQDPQAEAGRQGTSVEQTGYRAPLAPHQLLINTAGAYSQRMLDQDFFSHTDPDGNGPLNRVLQSGYPAFIVGENIVWSGTTGNVDPTALTYQLHRNLFLSSGHRAGMLDTGMREIGVGIRGGHFIDPQNGRAYNALMGTELFASRTSNFFITGVAFTDQVVDDAFYNVGEALANVLVTARNQSTGATFTTTTGPSGGYTLEVPTGIYTVTFSGGGLLSPSVRPNISINGANQKVDFDQSDQRATTLPRNFIVTGADAGGGPHVRVLDAQTGLEWLSLLPYNSGFTGGVRVATGDVNGDGVLDVITAPGPGMASNIKVFDGRTGGEIANFLAYDARFGGGVFVAAADVNGDNRADIITAPSAGGGPHVRVFSGLNQQVLTEFLAYDPFFTGGVHVAAGNVDGSGFAEILTAPAAGGGPHVRLFNGQTGQPLNHPAGNFFAYSPAFFGGVYIATADVNLDGRSDIITGAGVGGGPHVRVFSGFNGTELNSFFAYDLRFTAGVRVSTSDVDNNNQPDIITAPGPGGGPHIRAFRGTQPSPMGVGASNFLAYSSAFFGGVFVAGGRNQALALIETLPLTNAPPATPNTLALTVENPQLSGMTLSQQSTNERTNPSLGNVDDQEENPLRLDETPDNISPDTLLPEPGLDDLFADKLGLGELLSV